MLACEQILILCMQLWSEIYHIINILPLFWYYETN